MGILSGIANPALADPVGSFEKGAQIGRDEETRRLVGKILGATTAGELGALARVNPQAAITLAGQLKFDDDPKKQLNEFVGTVQLAAAVGKAVGPRESLAILVESRNRIKAMVDKGMMRPGATTTLDGMIQKFNETPNQGIEALNLMNDALVEQGLAKSPKGDEKTPAFRTLKSRAEAAGLKSGTPKFQEFMLHGGPAPKTGRVPDQRDRKIEDHMRLFDKTKKEATRSVDSATMIDDKGNLITFDPFTGEGKLVDVDTGVESPIITPPKGVTIEDLSFDPSKGTGFAAAWIGLWNSTLGQLPFLPIGKDTELAAQNLRILERDAIRALASSGRPPIVEQQRIIKLVPEAMDWFQNPEVAKFKMTNFIDLMVIQFVDDMRYSQNRRNPKKVRDESAGRARRIESIVRRVMTPVAAQAMFDSLNKMETEMGQIRDMSETELDSVDPAILSNSQEDAYIDRMRSDIEDLERLMSNGG